MWTGLVAPWLPILLIVIVAALALTEAGAPPATPAAKRLWMASIVIFGTLAIAGSVWQERRATHAMTHRAGAAAPASQSEMAEKGATVSALTEKVNLLEEQLKALEESERARAISADTTEKLADYLRQFGSRRIVVSCVPDDVEAYYYANQLVNVFRAANWDAQGPEITKIYGDIRALGVNLYVSEDDHSDTARIVLDGFAKFNIPNQARVSPSRAIRDTQTVELFVAAKPSEPAKSGSSSSARGD